MRRGFGPTYVYERRSVPKSWNPWNLWLMKTTADVVIVGGGCMGASAAYYLAERGVTNLVLFEREPQLGTASTGRNAGGFRHQFSHPANIALSKESIALFANFEEAIGHPIDFWPDGYLFLLSSEASVSAFRANVALQRAHGIGVDWLSAADAADLCPGLAVDGVIGATYCGDDGIADPNGVTQGFAKAAQARGVEIRRGEEVTGVRVEGGRVTGVEASRRHDRHPDRRQRGRRMGTGHRPAGRHRCARDARTPSHLHRAAARWWQLG